MVEKLRSLGKKVECFSKTHVASGRINGTTIDHWVRRHVLHGSCSADVLFWEEFTLTDTPLIAQLNKVSHLQFIVAGDPHQMHSPFDSWRGCSVPEEKLEKSRFLHRICSGNVLRLTECMRSDAELFSFFSQCIYGGTLYKLGLQEALIQARERFNYQGVCENNFVLSHRRRIRINREVAMKLAPKEGTLILPAQPRKGEQLSQQSMMVWVGCTLLGCCQSIKKGIRNGLRYEVLKIEEEYVILRRDSQEFRLTQDEVKLYTRMAWARTMASIQGDEVTGSLRIWDTQSRHFTLRHLYVCLSRARDASLVSVI
jgi:hypothetical protein